MGVLINVGSIMGKEILNLADGTIAGRVCGISMTPDCKVAGIKVRERKFRGTVNYVPFENIKAFGATVTVDTVLASMGGDVRDALGKTVIGVDGDTFGKVEELAFDAETAELSEIVVKGDLMDTTMNGHGILDGSKVVSIGKDVVIVAAGITPEDFTAPGEEFYGDWKAMDEVLDELEQDGAAPSGDEVSFDEESFEFEAEAEKIGTAFEEGLDSFAKAMEDAFSKLRKEFTSDRMRAQTDRFIDRFGEETKNLFHSVHDMVKDMDTTEWKDNLKNMVNRKDDPEEVLANDLVQQLADLTVEKPVLDEEGNVIIWPGQIIGKSEIKAALRAGVLQDLLDLATVSLKTEEEKAAEAEATEEAAPEIEVEVFVDEDAFPEVTDEEDAAFIAEEVAKMEQAEAADEPEIEVEVIVEEAEEAEAVAEEDPTACVCDLEEEQE